MVTSQKTGLSLELMLAQAAQETGWGGSRPESLIIDAHVLQKAHYAEYNYATFS